MANKISDEEYNELSDRMRAANRDLQDLIDTCDPSDLSELEMRAFDQGYLAGMQQYLPFAVCDRIMFDAIKKDVADTEKTIKERKGEDDAEADETTE